MGDPRYSRIPGISEKEVGDVVFLVNSNRETIHHLNPLGAAVWRLLAEPVSIPEAADVVHRAFPGTSRDQAEADIADLMAKLVKEGLVTGGE